MVKIVKEVIACDIWPVAMFGPYVPTLARYHNPSYLVCTISFHEVLQQSLKNLHLTENILPYFYTSHQKNVFCVSPQKNIYSVCFQIFFQSKLLGESRAHQGTMGRLSGIREYNQAEKIKGNENNRKDENMAYKNCQTKEIVTQLWLI